MQADTSLDVVWMGCTCGRCPELMYRHDQGIEALDRSFGWEEMRCQPPFSLGMLVWEFTGVSWRARRRKLVVFGLLKREFNTAGDLLQFSCRIAAEPGILDDWVGCAIMG